MLLLKLFWPLLLLQLFPLTQLFPNRRMETRQVALVHGSIVVAYFIYYLVLAGILALFEISSPFGIAAAVAVIPPLLGTAAWRLGGKGYFLYVFIVPGWTVVHASPHVFLLGMAMSPFDPLVRQIFKWRAARAAAVIRRREEEEDRARQLFVQQVCSKNRAEMWEETRVRPYLVKMVVHPDGSLWVFEGFHFEDHSKLAFDSVGYLFRLLPDGSEDPEFQISKQSFKIKRFELHVALLPFLGGPTLLAVNDQTFWLGERGQSLPIPDEIAAVHWVPKKDVPPPAVFNWESFGDEERRHLQPAFLIEQANGLHLEALGKNVVYLDCMQLLPDKSTLAVAKFEGQKHAGFLKFDSCGHPDRKFLKNMGDTITATGIGQPSILGDGRFIAIVLDPTPWRGDSGTKTLHCFMPNGERDPSFEFKVVWDFDFPLHRSSLRSWSPRKDGKILSYHLFHMDGAFSLRHLMVLIEPDGRLERLVYIEGLTGNDRELRFVLGPDDEFYANVDSSGAYTLAKIDADGKRDETFAPARRTRTKHDADH